LSEWRYDFEEIAEVLEGLIESWYMFYVIVDKEGYIKNMNQTLLQAMELRKEDVVGKYILGYP
jgi:transcriptional regulator with PAS, ATPase and Fis domain